MRYMQLIGDHFKIRLLISPTTCLLPESSDVPVPASLELSRPLQILLPDSDRVRTWFWSEKNDELQRILPDVKVWKCTNSSIGSNLILKLYPNQLHVSPVPLQNIDFFFDAYLNIKLVIWHETLITKLFSGKSWEYLII